jgi:hypothetical protein
MKRPFVPLVVEPHPQGYTGLPYVTLVCYREKEVLTIIDNCTDKYIKAYILDLCGPEDVDQTAMLQVAEHWYDNERDARPLSFTMSIHGVAQEGNKILRTYNTEYVTRVIGPMFRYPMNEVVSVKRRKRKHLPADIEIVTKSTVVRYSF